MGLTPKAIALYEPTAKNPEDRCGRCRFFRPPSRCAMVAGGVRAEGWCVFFFRGRRRP